MHIVALFTLFFLASDTASVPGNVLATKVPDHTAAFASRHVSSPSTGQGQAEQRPKKLKNKESGLKIANSHKQNVTSTTPSADPSSDAESNHGARPAYRSTQKPLNVGRKLGCFVPSSSVGNSTGTPPDPPLNKESNIAVETPTAQQPDPNNRGDSSNLADSSTAKQPDSPLGKESSASSTKKPVTKKIIIGFMLLLICVILGIGITFVSSNQNQ